MPIHDDLGVRMKGYEKVSRNSLIKRTPVAIRIDGKAFHTFTKGMKKPFDNILVEAMQKTTKYLCENIQGCVFGYTQSDEITLILIDYQTFKTSAWFDYEVQKICSIAASMATMAFNQNFNSLVEKAINHSEICIHDYINTYAKLAMFDARCFNISKEEVCNLVYWRQLDAIRNSIQMVGQANFSHKTLQNKSCEMIKEMLRKTAKIKSWEDYPIYLQRGTACIKDNSNWKLDLEMPILKGEDRNYIEKYIFGGEE